MKPYWKGKEEDPFYKSTAWKHARTEILLRDAYVCQDCLAAMRAGERMGVRLADTVHHIKPRDKFPELELDPENLVSLCRICHNKRHDEKGGHNKRVIEIPSSVRVIKV